MKRFWDLVFEPIYRQFRSSRPQTIVTAVLFTVALFGSILLYLRRNDRPMIYYYGASPQAPGGTAIPILNPFRDKKDESNAEWLIQDLRSSQCEQIVRQRFLSDPAGICPVLHRTTISSLVWLDRKGRYGNLAGPRELVYDLPETHSRLVIVFGTSEAGWGVNAVWLLR